MAENFVNIIRDIRGSTNDPATDTSCIYGDMKSMHEEYKGFKQITDEERLKLENIEEEATKNSTDQFLLSRANHTGTMSMADIVDSNSRFAMTANDRNKLDAAALDATKNDTDENLRNRETHTGVQSIDTVVDSSTHLKMTINERSKLEDIEASATRNSTDENLRDRSTHTGTQSADTIVNGVTNAAFTNAEKVKLAVLDITKPPEHLHHMNEITLGNLDASRIAESSAQQFVSSIEKDRISGSEQAANKGVPNGYAPLGPNGKINPSYLDSLNVIDVFTPVDFEAMLLLSSAKPGDLAYVQSFQDTYMLIALPSDNHLNWKKLNSAAGVVSINGLNGVVSMSSDELPEGIANKYFTEDRVTDRVKNFIKAGTNVTVSYNPATNELTISANDTSVEWSEIQNKPSPNISVEIAGDASGSANTTLTELASGSIEINNLTLKNTGTAGTYRSVTTDAQGRVIAGTNPTTVSGYGLTDVHTKTENNTSLALKVNNSEKGVANGIATLDENGKVVLTQIPDSVLGQLEYIGTWNFTTMPTATQKGQYWIASTSGNGYMVGDWAVWNGSAFDKVDNTDAVSTVAGRTGNVVLTKSDVGLGLVDNTADSTKNVLSATKLTTARLINGVAFDGSANITVSDATAVNLTENQTIGGIKTFTSNIVGNVTGNISGNATSATSATKLATPRQINGVNFDGSGNITILDSTKVALTGNETIDGTKTFSSTVVGNISGNAGTATKLQTARTINGVAFDGSTNITVSDSTAVKLTGDQTVAGVKTFSSSPIVPTPATNTQVANKEYVDTQITGLGTAATADITTSHTDITVGRVLKVGDFGVGLAISIADADLIYISGLYRVEAATLNIPVALWGSLYCSGDGTTGITTQIYIISGTGCVYTRGRQNSVWSPWLKLYHTGNTTLNPDGTIKASSPVINLYTDKHDLHNEEQFGATPVVTRKSKGVYEITGTLGLRLEGWYLDTPSDRNGNKYFNIEWTQNITPDSVDGVVDEYRDDIVVTIETFERVWNKDTGMFDNGNPVDINDLQNRFVQLRFNEIKVEQEVDNG